MWQTYYVFTHFYQNAQLTSIKFEIFHKNLTAKDDLAIKPTFFDP